MRYFASRIGVQLFIFFKSSELSQGKRRNKFLPLNMKINDTDNYILFCKRAFSDVLEGVTSKIFLGTSHQTPVSLVECLSKGLLWYVFVDPLA